MPATCSRRWRSSSRFGFTLIEVVLALTIIGILTAAGMFRIRHLLNAVSVRAAGADAAELLELARHTAMARSERISVDIDTAPARLTMRAGADTIRRRNEYVAHGVRFAVTRSPVVYNQLGLGFGVSNLSLVISKGAAAETVTVSRLGRVRH